MGIDKKRIIRIVTDAADNYDKYLNEKCFLIVYQSNDGMDFAEVSFRNMNFKHLTGIQSRLTAIQFYEACLDDRLSEDEITIDSKGKVMQKVKVLPYLHKLLYHNCMIGDFINSGVMIQADYFVGDTKLVLSVGFRKDETTDYPVTLYSGDVRKLTNPTNKVLAIFKKSYSDTEYSETSYIAKGFDISEVNPPDNIKVVTTSPTSNEVQNDDHR